MFGLTQIYISRTTYSDKMVQLIKINQNKVSKFMKALTHWSIFSWVLVLHSLDRWSFYSKFAFYIFFLLKLFDLVLFNNSYEMQSNELLFEARDRLEEMKISKPTAFIGSWYSIRLRYWPEMYLKPLQFSNSESSKHKCL